MFIKLCLDLLFIYFYFFFKSENDHAYPELSLHLSDSVRKGNWKSKLSFFNVFFLDKKTMLTLYKKYATVVCRIVQSVVRT